MSVSYGGDSITFADGSVTSSGWTGFKNRIINGAMVIDQRRAGSANNAPIGDQYQTDRFMTYCTTANKLIAQQINGSNTAASNYESGGAPINFTHSIKLTANGGISLGTTDAFSLRQRIEGVNVDDLSWGNINAKTVTLSFWVKSSNTGYYSVAIYNAAADISYVSDYQVTQANTWEKKSITINGPTSGTWYKQTAIAIQVHFDLGSGTTYKTGTTNTWLSGCYLQSTTSNSLVATNGTTLYLTGVQFEVGSTASSFEYRPYGTELALCQRYYNDTGLNMYSSWGSASGYGTWAYSFPVVMRTTPSATMSNQNGSLYGSPYINDRSISQFLSGLAGSSAGQVRAILSAEL